MIWVLFFLFLKHFIVDFPLQTKFQWSNKGTYGHIGGILHAILHGTGTYIVLICFTTLPLAAAMFLFDTIVHYHIDWAKMYINKRFNWHPEFNPEFWWLLGLDQFLHYITYLIIVAIIL